MGRCQGRSLEEAPGAILDEIQRVPGLLSYIQVHVDEWEKLPPAPKKNWQEIVQNYVDMHNQCSKKEKRKMKTARMHSLIVTFFLVLMVWGSLFQHNYFGFGAVI